MQGGFYDFPYGCGKVLTQTAPLIMTGLSVAFAFKTGLFNIGAAGQYTLGAFGALYFAIVLGMPWWVCLLVSAVFGALWGAMVIKSGRYGKFVACSGFPECRNAHPIVKDTGGLCPLCGGHMLLRKSAKGRVYYGCSNYPTCNFMTWDEPVPETCPHCGKTLFKRRGQLYCAKEGCGFVKNIEKTNAEK